MSLELRLNCECCDRDLPPESLDAVICSFECTYCRDCASSVLGGKCPNCSGELVRRPARPAEKPADSPSSTKHVWKAEGLSVRQSDVVKAKAVIPGEIIAADGDLELNAGQPTITIEVANTGDRPVQVGSHYHFAETNAGLDFERDKAQGMRLDIPAGTAVRFEPGQKREVTLVPLSGKREVYGFRKLVMGRL